MAKPLIKVTDLVKNYQTDEVVTPVLRGVSFAIEKGEFVSIMGPSGSGKSTLMHILGFLDTLSTGRYEFEGRDVSQLSDDELAEMRGNKVGFVFQAFNLLARTTARENVALPLVYSKADHGDRLAKATKILESVGLGHRLDHSPNQLSGGEKQRVAIARALINNPEVIFADEPTGNLDSKSGAQVMKILQDLNDDGHTIILVTHEMHTAEHAKRIIQVRDGLIIKDDAVRNRNIASAAGELKK